jgi:hypothetical protein
LGTAAGVGQRVGLPERLILIIEHLHSPVSQEMLPARDRRRHRLQQTHARSSADPDFEA